MDVSLVVNGVQYERRGDKRGDPNDFIGWWKLSGGRWVRVRKSMESLLDRLSLAEKVVEAAEESFKDGANSDEDKRLLDALAAYRSAK